jgi:hypothetical protein
MRPGELWVLRPDAHVAAVLTHADAVLPALERMLTTTHQTDPLPPTPRTFAAGPWWGPRDAVH